TLFVSAVSPSMRGKNPLHIELRHRLEGGAELVERAALAVPLDVRSVGSEQLIPGQQNSPFGEVETQMSPRVAGGQQRLHEAERGRNEVAMFNIRVGRDVGIEAA